MFSLAKKLVFNFSSQKPKVLEKLLDNLKNLFKTEVLQFDFFQIGWNRRKFSQLFNFDIFCILHKAATSLLLRIRVGHWKIFILNINYYFQYIKAVWDHRTLIAATSLFRDLFRDFWVKDYVGFQKAPKKNLRGFWYMLKNLLSFEQYWLAKLAQGKEVMQGKLFQKCTHL